MLQRRSHRRVVTCLTVLVVLTLGCDAVAPSDLRLRREFLRELPAQLCAPTGYYGVCLGYFDYSMCMEEVGMTVRECGNSKRPKLYPGMNWETTVLSCVRGLMKLSYILQLSDSERCESWPVELSHRQYDPR